jgi:hypothetical protein
MVIVGFEKLLLLLLVFENNGQTDTMSLTTMGVFLPFF